ncbi:AaceriACR274Wp [[Ashbya] aceris (nom. inval.)]|nr:AaceriACR274Wp [[Ashbya] aceris (nom. inval.)]
MSALNKLFGDERKRNLESTVTALFSQSSGPVDALEVKSKPRTLLPGASTRQDTETSAPAETEAIPEAIPEATHEDDLPRKRAKKAKKAKKNDEEDDHLEEKYMQQVLQEDSGKESEVEASEESTEPVTEAKSATEAKPSSRATRPDMKEEELAKAERTVFVGNVPHEVITDKKVYKEFKQFVAQRKPSKDDEDEEQTPEKYTVESIRFRSIAFEEALPRKVAFVQQKLHHARDSVNAYVVYAEKEAVLAACKLNGSVFHDHHLRFDSVAHPAPHDRKRSVFVGNLDFEESEESLWKHFMSCGPIEYVRVVRDPKTNVGKGFAYVQFVDLVSVNKALMLNDKKMTVGKGRKLRVTRCRNMQKVQRQANTAAVSKLTDQQKTKFGRARKVLGKADRATLGKLTIEGTRATKGANTPNLRAKKARSKTGRVTKRSQAYKKAEASKKQK